MKDLKVMKLFLFLCSSISVTACAANCSEQVVEKWALEKSEGYTLEVKNRCDEYAFEVSLLNGDGSIVLGDFNSPYSQTMSVETILSSKFKRYLFVTNVSEPEPQGSFYFMVFGLNGKVHLSGYADTLVYAKDIDSDGEKEIVVGSNINNTDPLKYLLDYVPYPVIYDFNSSGRLLLQPSSRYKHVFSSYLKDERAYKKALEGKIKDRE